MTLGKLIFGINNIISMDWLNIQTIEDVNALDASNSVVLLFKHSTRCIVSSMALDRLERNSDKLGIMKSHMLDLISHRDVSNYVEEYYGVQHESPQILLIKNGEVIYHASHNAISVNDILKYV